MFANFDVTPSFLFTVLLACNRLQPSQSQTQVDCNDYPCFNGGTCIPGFPDICICPPGYVQPFCTISCLNAPCVNGVCDGDVCNCPTNFAGPTCTSAFFAYLNPVAVTVSEGNSDHVVTVQVCRQPDNTQITLQVYTSPRSASGGSDYENIPFSQDVTIPMGQVCTTETVTIRADQMFEQTEEFCLVLLIPEILQRIVYTLPGNTQTIITIMNDDPVNCDLDRPCFNGGTCRPSVLQNPCTCPAGFFEPFCTTSCLTDTCQNGGACRDDVCSCQSGSAGPTCQSDIAVYLSPVEVSVTEGDTGHSNVRIHLCRQQSNLPVTVTVVTSPGSAATSLDFVSINTAVTIPFGQVCAPVDISIVSDMTFEPAEVFHLDISPTQLPSPVSIVPGQGTATVTIIDIDDCSNYLCYNGGTCVSRPPGMCICPSGVVQPFCTISCQNIQVPCVNGGCFGEVCSCSTNFAGPTCESAIFAYLSPLEITVTEGHVGQKAVSVQVCRQPSSEEVTLAVYTPALSASDSALSGIDFVDIPLNPRQDVMISAGKPCAPVNVFIISDLTPETMSKDFFLVLYDPQSSSMVHTVSGHDLTTITITDDDPDTEPPTIHNCPDDITVTAPVGAAATTVSWTPPTATDLSGAVTPTSSQNPGDSFTIGTTQVTYTANDGANNAASCVFTVIVVDYNECAFPKTMCDSSSSTCVNNIGSYRCECKSGFTGSPYTPPGQPTCADRDECTVSPFSALCDRSSSTCMNTIGSFICVCKSGYTGSTFQPGQTSTCTDVNECLTPQSTECDLTKSDCSNRNGGYVCMCNSGFIGSQQYPSSVQQSPCQADVTPPVISDCPPNLFSTVQIGDADKAVSWTEPTATDNSGTAFLDSQSHSPGSVFPVGTTSVTYRYTDPAGNEAVCIFDVTVQEDCIRLNSAGPCSRNECSCTKGTCTSQAGRCEATCSVYQCPANIASESLCQVNPQSSVEIKCILEGSTAVVTKLDMRLSRLEEAIDDRGITQLTDPDISANRREETYRVISVSEDDQFFCMLSQVASIVGSINVTGFVYKLPSISDPPTEVNRTTTSVTITWRPWNEQTDVGDPPVVAYIPYYKMDPSQDWMSGSRIQADQTLEHTASSLESDRNYTFSVAAVREEEGGEGPRGPPVTIKTLCIDVVPQMVTTTLTATNDVTVTWQPPTVQCSTGITKFTIYYEIEGDVSSRLEAGTADPNAETFTVDGSLLEAGTTYNIAVTVTTDQESALSEGRTVTATNPTGSSGSLVAIIIGVVIVVLIVLILLLLIFIVVRKRKMEDQPDPIYDQPLNDIGKQSGPSGSTDHSSGAVNMALNVTEVKKTKESAVADSSVPDEGGIYGNLEPPSPIKKADFPEYIVNNIGKVEHEFGLLEGVQQKHPWTVAEEEFNRKKNRFRNMYPYDHCRVVLPKLPGDHSSDYYNASFILNARDERAYIASQAPNKASVDDFWRLIWEQNVQTIVMLANLYEAAKERCLQYWPKEESETQSFGYIDVTWTKTQHFADYVIRTLSVKRDRTTRDIEQLHFKEWPDKDIPDNAMCLVEFARHCKLIHFKKQTPFLIHCSAGIGRTGTFIGLLSMMDVLQSEEYIDIFAFVNKMRENRVNMIQTKQQYRYLHTCLYEFHLTRDCQISAQSLSRFKIKDNKAAILREFQLLSEMEMSMATDSHKTGRTTDSLGRGSSSASHETDWSMAREHAPRDRFGNMVPLERRKVFLISSSPSNPDNYINASFVKSYEKKDAFITTQSPLPNTIEDFWRMIYDHKCRTVVMLNQLDGEDKTCVQYWPNRGSLQYGIMTVTCIATEQHSDYVKRTFDVTLNNSANVISVTHLQLEDWPPKGSPQSLIRLITDAHKLQEEANVEKPLVVHCINGFGRSGVFVTVQSEIERIRATGLVDIFATVKKLRNEHQHMMKKKMEYKLCFDFLIEFSKRYDNYENW